MLFVFFAYSNACVFDFEKIIFAFKIRLYLYLPAFFVEFVCIARKVVHYLPETEFVADNKPFFKIDVKG